MPAEVSICNNALIKLGEDTITALTENSKAGRLCNALYADTRDTVLREHVWNFAMKRVQLAENTTAPVFGYANAFDLPSDCLRVISMQDTTYVFKIEANQLVTDESTAQIRYIARITDPTQFDALFTEALAARLAAEMAVPLVDSATAQQAMFDLFSIKLAEARTIDATEGTPDTVEADTWLDARLSGASITVTTT